MDFDVRVAYAKEGSDANHRSNGIAIYFKDASVLGKEYVNPIVIDNRLYFDLSDEYQGRGKYLKLTNPCGTNKNSNYRRIKRVSLDLDYLRQFIPFIGEHRLEYDSGMNLHFIVSNALAEDTTLPLFMMPKNKGDFDTKEQKNKPKLSNKPANKGINLSDQIARTLVDAGMIDKITDTKAKQYQEHYKAKDTQNSPKMLSDLTAEEFFSGIYKSIYSAITHAVEHEGISKECKVETLLEKVKEIEQLNFYGDKGDYNRLVPVDEVINIVEKYYK